MRDLVAIDEEVVKANEKYYVYSAIDVERNKLILMRVSTATKEIFNKSFIKEVLNYCENN